MNKTDNKPIYKYDAFISYKHEKLDSFIAKLIQKKLERYHIPKKIQKLSGKEKIHRIFRDEEELSLSSDLPKEIKEALETSEYLIVICSKASKKSKWVQREIACFLECNNIEHILLVFVEGEPSDCFPDILYQKYDEKYKNDNILKDYTHFEPLAADFCGTTKRKICKKCRTEILRIISAILGCSYDDLKQRHREYLMLKRIWIMAGALVLSIMFTFYAIGEQNKIEHEYQIGLQNQTRYLCEKAHLLMDKGDRIEALKMATSIIPQSKNNGDIIPEQRNVLNRLLFNYQYCGNHVYAPTVMYKQDGLCTAYNGFTKNKKYFFCVDRCGIAYIYENGSKKLHYKISDQTFCGAIPFLKSEILFFTDDTFYIIDVENKQVLKTIKSDTKNLNNAVVALTEEVLVCAITNSASVSLYNLNTAQKTNVIHCRKLTDELEDGGQFMCADFSKDGKFLAIGISLGDTEFSSKKHTVFVFETETGNLVNSFWNDNIVQIRFVGNTELAFTSWSNSDTSEFLYMYFEREYSSQIFEFKTGKCLWQGNMHRYVSYYGTHSCGVININNFMINDRYKDIIIFYNKEKLEVVDKSDWTTCHQYLFEEEIISVQKINDNFMLIALSNGTIYSSSMAVYILAAELTVPVDYAYYDSESDTIIQISNNETIFLVKPIDTDMEYYGEIIPEKIVDPQNVGGNGDNPIISGKKYCAELKNNKVIVYSLVENNILLTLPIEDKEKVIFNFLTENEYLVVYNMDLCKLTIWDIENAEPLREQMLNLNCTLKNQFIVDNDGKMFALNLSKGLILTDKGVKHRTLDIFSWDENMQVYHYAEVVNGYVDFASKKIYCQNSHNGKIQYYVHSFYTFEELKEKISNLRLQYDVSINMT